MKPAKHIGIVAVSEEGAALCYRTICAEGTALVGPHNHPEITIGSRPCRSSIRPGSSQGRRCARRFVRRLDSSKGQDSNGVTIVGVALMVNVIERDKPTGMHAPNPDSRRERKLELIVRHAVAADLPTIMELLRLKADFDGCPDAFEATLDSLGEAWFSDPPKAFALVAEVVTVHGFAGDLSCFRRFG